MFYKKILSFFILQKLNKKSYLPFVWNSLWKLAISKWNLFHLETFSNNILRVFCTAGHEEGCAITWMSFQVYYYGLGLEAAQEMKAKTNILFCRTE